MEYSSEAHRFADSHARMKICLQKVRRERHFMKNELRSSGERRRRGYDNRMFAGEHYLLYCEWRWKLLEPPNLCRRK